MTKSAVRISLKAPAIALAGVLFDNVGLVETIALIEQMLAERKPRYIVTPNSDFLRLALSDVEFRRILLEAHLSLCDGMPLVWASRILGNPLQERVTGSDLVPALIRVAEKRNYRIFFLGGTPEVTGQAVANLKSEHPELNVAGYYSPPFQKLLEMDHDEAIGRIRAARPDLLFVSLGTPKGEKWIAMHCRSLGVPVCINVGATIDFLAGRVIRAPRWMQRTGSEWIFRLAQEPARLLSRYVADFAQVGWALVRQWNQLSLHPARSESQPAMTLDAAGPFLRVHLPGRVDHPFVTNQSAVWDQVLRDERTCLVHSDRVSHLDSTGVALLMRLQRDFRVQGRSLILVKPSEPVTRALRLMRVEEFFRQVSDSGLATPTNATDRCQIVLRSSEDAVVSWFGEVTAESVRRVWTMTRFYLRRRSRREWQIDLSEVRFMDSSGAALVVRLRQYARKKGALLRLVSPRPGVRNVLRLAQVEIA